MDPLSHLYSHPLIQHVARVARELCVPVYLVGGSVRDALRNVEHSRDLDFALFEGFDEVVTRFARENHGKIIPWDVDQKRIVFRQGTVLVTVDFSRMPTPDIIHDLKQRDFTINAMALAVHEDEAGLIDPLNGKVDLSGHCLRMCSGTVFEDDPLRMLRAVRFARQLSCVIEPGTRESMRLNSGLIGRSARERIKREIFMILQGPSQGASLRELHACGLLEKLLPEDALQGMGLDTAIFERKILIADSLGNMLQKSDRRFDGVQQLLRDYVGKDFEDGVTMMSLLAFAVLLRSGYTSEHDAGLHAQDDMRASKFVQKIAGEIGLGRRAQKVVASLVGNQGRIVQMIRHANVTERMKSRFVLDCEEGAAGVCLLAIADNQVTASNPVSQGVLEIAYDICVYSLDAQHVHAPLLTGDDVRGCLGIGAGPRIGDILKQSAQLERDGILHNREAALLWLKNLFQTA